MPLLLSRHYAAAAIYFTPPRRHDTLLLPLLFAAADAFVAIAVFIASFRLFHAASPRPYDSAAMRHCRRRRYAALCRHYFSMAPR